MIDNTAQLQLDRVQTKKERGGVIVPIRGSKYRVLLDARKIFDGGIGMYTRNLIAGLAQNNNIKLSIWVPSKVICDPRFSKYPWLDRVEVIEENTKPYSYEEMFSLGKKVTKERFDLFHTPHYVLPLGIKIPTVVTIHDLIHVKYPEKFYYPVVAMALIMSAMKRASKILTVSQATYNDLKKVYPIANIVKKISVVPNPIEPTFLNECKNASEYVSAHFKLNTPYLLSVFSTLKPHKGIEDLLQSFLEIKKKAVNENGAYSKACSDLKLVLVGQGMESLASMSSLLDNLGEIKDVFVLGAVSNDELLNLYAASVALVVPSLAEGFGLPVIEAQAQGKPVISRPIPSVMELLSKHDIVCKDFSREALESGLVSFIERYACGEYADPLFDIADKMRQFDRNEISRVVASIYEDAIMQKRN